jgi:hypothetical protein
MPCSSGPDREEDEIDKELRDLREFCEELELDSSIVRGKSRRELLDLLTARLCEHLQKHKKHIATYSLELQIWWRDHQKTDKARIEKELKQAKESKERDAALSKLTSYEKKLLGLK